MPVHTLAERAVPVPPAVLIIDRGHPDPLRLIAACPPDIAVVVLTDDPASFVAGLQTTAIQADVTTMAASSPPDIVAAAAKRAFASLHKSLRHRRLIIDLDRRIARVRGVTALEQPTLGDIVEHLPVGVVVLRRDGTVRGMNATAGRILDRPGVPPRTTFSSLFQDHAAVDALIASARSSSSPVPPAMSTAHQTVRGVRWLTVTMRRTASPGNDATMVTVIEDVTDRAEAGRSRARAERAAGAARLRLERIDRTRRTFLAALSHDVRGPLTSILGFTQTLVERDQTMDAEQRRRSLETILRNGRQILSMVEELVDAGLISDDELNPEPTDVFARLTRIVPTLKTEGHVVTVGNCSIVAMIDPIVFDRIVSNLVQNAARHTPSGSTIEVIIERTASGIVIRVDDNGPGVPDEEKDAVFQAFRRRGDSPGSGIGLWLVGRLADAHGGRAWVQDRPGGGASFRALLAEPAR